MDKVGPLAPGRPVVATRMATAAVRGTDVVVDLDKRDGRPTRRRAAAPEVSVAVPRAVGAGARRARVGVPRPDEGDAARLVAQAVRRMDQAKVDVRHATGRVLPDLRVAPSSFSAQDGHLLTARVRPVKAPGKASASTPSPEGPLVPTIGVAAAALVA